METHATFVSQRAHFYFSAQAKQIRDSSRTMLVSVISTLNILLIRNFLVQYFKFKANKK